jgi:hypothetical protein
VDDAPVPVDDSAGVASALRLFRHPLNVMDYFVVVLLIVVGILLVVLAVWLSQQSNVNNADVSFASGTFNATTAAKSTESGGGVGGGGGVDGVYGDARYGMVSATLPPPPPIPATGSVIQFVNQTSVTLLLGSLLDLLPNEGTWVMPPGGVLTLQVPVGANANGNGPRFWARLGCHYDADTNKAQCLIGDCGGVYTCTTGNSVKAGKAPVSIAEFCFNCGGGNTYYDVSLVDGYSISMNITPIDTSVRPNDPHWNVTQQCNYTGDLRSICPADFSLRASDVSSFAPSFPGEDYTIACFSNCGKYEYPNAPSIDCDDSDPQCAGWRKYCCQQKPGQNIYGSVCANDTNCDYSASCWQRPGVPNMCACRGYYVAEAPCPPDVCTYQDAVSQPPLEQCASGECVGDDTLHSICPRAYTWPNDPQTHYSDSKRWRIVFYAPGENQLPLPNSSSGFPLCSSLPANYNYPQARIDCGTRTGLAGAHITTPWDCDVSAPDQNTNGVMCQW